MTWSTVTEGDPERLGKRRRWEFSRQYLDKLINIEIPARPISAVQYEELVLQNARAIPSTDVVSYITMHGLKILFPVLVSVLLIVSMASIGMWIGALKQPTPVTSGTGLAVTATTVPNAAFPSTARTSLLPSQPVAAELFSLNPPGKAGVSGLTYIWAFTGGGLFLYFCWRILTRKEDGIVKDSPKFRQALELWDSVIILSHDTPRSTKRFMNRLRCLAMRLRPANEERTRWNTLRRQDRKPSITTTDPAGDLLPESMLVLLSALYDISPLIVRDADLFANALEV